MIKIVDVSKKFHDSFTRRKVVALQDLNLQVQSGEVFGFLGPNGAGKSTTIKILMDLIHPDCGSATINGMDVRKKETRRHVGFLPENPYFYDYLTADELLWFGGKCAGLAASQIKERSALLLERVDLIGARKRPLRTYSKGMVQRAGLALALIHDPTVVILDEPMSGLDPVGRKMVGDLIIELRQQGKTVFFSSHILTDIERFCDRFAILVNGQLRLVESVGQLLAGNHSLEEIFLAEVGKATTGEA